MNSQDLPVPERGGEEVVQRMDEILARPEFRQPGKPLLQRILEEIERRIGDVFEALTSGGRASLVAWAIVVALAAAIAFMAARFARSVGRDPVVKQTTGASEPVRPAVAWRSEAEAHEANGRWRDAVRCRYRALVADLASRGVVEEIPGRTSGEYRGLVASTRPAAAGDFSSASDVFDRAWYGGIPAGPDDAARLRSLEDRVLTGTSS